jgi:hypothetical protein
MAKTKKSPKVKKKSRKDKLVYGSMTAAGGAAGFGLGKAITRKNIRSTKRLIEWLDNDEVFGQKSVAKRARSLRHLPPSERMPDLRKYLAKEYYDEHLNIARHKKYIRGLNRLPYILGATGAGLTAAAIYKRKKAKGKKT